MSSTPTPQAGDANRSLAFLAVSLGGTGIALLSCILRLIVRLRVVRSIGWDDYFIVISTVSTINLVNRLLPILSSKVLAIVGSGLNIPEGLYGFGRHAFDLTKHQRIEATKFSEFALPWLVMSTCFSKISICMFLLRVVEKQKRSW